ncbi:MAG: YfdX family protein [Terracidiphilus sp.]
MKRISEVSQIFITIALAACMGSAGCNSDRSNTETKQTSPSAQPQAQQQNTSVSGRRQDAERQVRPEVEKQRNEQNQRAQSALNPDAIAAINQTQQAINAIGAGKTHEALSDIETATGKINILVARNPATALIPVQVEVDVIDNAPRDEKTLKRLSSDAVSAVAVRDYPTARVLLDGLRSEIRERTYSLPLATYPIALQNAARSLDAGKADDASNALLTALNTLVIVDHVTPIPLVLARAAVDTAQDKSKTDKNTAQTLLTTAGNELKLCSQLGYASHAPEYASLNSEIGTLQKQLKGTSDTGSFFARLRSDMERLLNKQSGQEHAQKS